MPVPHRTRRPEDSTRRPDMARFEWQRCPRHPWAGVSVIVTRDGSPPWCIEGHAVEPVAA